MSSITSATFSIQLPANALQENSRKWVPAIMRETWMKTLALGFNFGPAFALANLGSGIRIFLPLCYCAFQIKLNLKEIKIQINLKNIQKSFLLPYLYMSSK